MQRSTRFNRPTLRGSSIAAVLFSRQEDFTLKAEPDTTTSISLAWTEPAAKPDNYRVERSTDGITFSTVTTVANTVFTYNDTGLTESTEYYYRIVPILGGADQTASNIANTWTVPSTPTSLTATAASQTQIDLAWTDVSTGNTAQVIERRSPAGSGSYSFIASVGATATSYSDTGLVAATQYEYQVAATNPATQSAYSTAANATTPGVGPPSPSWDIDFSTGSTYADLVLTRASTGTYVDSSGYIASASIDDERLTHNSSGSRLGLLVEEARQNLWIRSAEFNTTWSTTDTTVTANQATAPDNTNAGDEIKEAVGTTVIRRVFQGNVTVTNSTVYTFSVFAKADTATCIQFVPAQSQFGSNEWATFDVSNGTLGSVGTSVTGSDATITDVGNGWYRCTLTATSTGTVLGNHAIHLTNNQTTTTRAPTYTVTSGNEKRLYLWGAQLEQGSAATSYIPTTTASVTRSADLAYIDPANVTNWGRPGSFVVEYYKPLNQAGNVVVAEDDLTPGDDGRLGVAYSSGGPRIVYGTSSAGSGGTDLAGLNKIGWAWDGSGAATRSALNGVALDNSLGTTFDPADTNGISLGGDIDFSALPLTVSNQPNVIIRKVTFYDSQLSAADLQTITGPTSYNVEYLVVAGGGGAGGGGTGAGSGGGAGGYRTASGFTLTPGTSYTITVGAGGAGGGGSTSGSTGNNSVFSTITSDGGGRGRQGVGGGLVGLTGGNGGSGGGGGYGDISGSAGGTATSGQGNNGGSPNSTSGFRGAGGGGAGASGDGGVPPNGGAGSANSITGTSVTRAGGGGGGSAGTAGAGGSGGGGGGGSGNFVAGTAGGANTGGGGGGGSDKTCNGGSGGSGVVIVRMATANYSAVHTPATVTTSGSDTILTFNASGTYTA